MAHHPASTEFPVMIVCSIRVLVDRVGFLGPYAASIQKSSTNLATILKPPIQVHLIPHVLEVDGILQALW